MTKQVRTTDGRRLYPLVNFPVTRRLILIFLLSIGALTVLHTSRPALAVNRTWDGGAADNNWSSPLNWSGDVIPGPGDIAIFDATSTKDAIIDTSFSVAGVAIN